MKQIKNKISAGVDEVPGKVVKLMGKNIVEELTTLLNAVARWGLPRHWRRAIVRPLHKKGDKSDQRNYRPISNICALSKLYERCVLNEIDKVEIDTQGENQHGFRVNRGTNTAMLTLQSILAEKLDSKKLALVYSIDMSAAFDLLRPELMEKCICDLPTGLQRCILDFLYNRKFVVEINGTRSEEKVLRVGCVQGSVLGPRLFSIYGRNLEVTLEKLDAQVVTYADDSYVVVSAQNVAELKEKAEMVFRHHNKFLKEIGMITNVTKTEATVFSKEPTILNLEVDGSVLQTGLSMNVLGVTFNHNLKWTDHVDKVMRKASGLLGRLRFMKKKLNKEQTVKVITSYYFPRVYYGAETWMNNASLTSDEWRLLNTSHYKALRIAVGDFKRKWSKQKLNKVCGRATPREWSHYTVANTVASILLNQEPLELFTGLI